MAAPPPPFNFAVLPNVEGTEPYWEIKRRAIETQQLSTEPKYEPIEVPRNSPTGFITAFFDTLGIGSFATTTSMFRHFKLVPDELIPGTLNVGITLPSGKYIGAVPAKATY